MYDLTSDEKLYIKYIAYIYNYATHIETNYTYA